ncbi:hypothetical protein V5P93_006869 [Actinokineospora auranticolor]|nr:hypothetical protein [Actinokineospora auranticolor]
MRRWTAVAVAAAAVATSVAVSITGASAATGAAADQGRRVEVAVATPVPFGPVAGIPKLEMVPDAPADRRLGYGPDLAVAKIPFDYDFRFRSLLPSRLFWPTSESKACVVLRGTGGSDPTYYGKEILVEMWDGYGNDTKVGPSVRYTLNGQSYGYCWTGTYPYHEHFFKLVKNWGPTIEVIGQGRVVAN